jgi:integrase/recombinase XerD
MPKNKMPMTLCKDDELSFSAAFELFLVDGAARGLSEKTNSTYRCHLQGMAHYLDTEMPLSKLQRSHINTMIVKMREKDLATNTISSYVRVLTTFLHWCDREGYCHVDPPKFKQVETVKETYTDDELIALLRRPSPTCRFSILSNNFKKTQQPGSMSHIKKLRPGSGRSFFYSCFY